MHFPFVCSIIAYMEDERILTILEKLHGLSKTGINYAPDQYNIDRYAEIKKCVEELYKFVPNFKDTIISTPDEDGYITPKVGMSAVIENENGELLLELRADNEMWGLPGGWAELGSSPEQNIIREVKEETGLNVEVKSLLEVQHRIPHKDYPFTTYLLLYHCEVISGEISISHESLDIAWKHINSINNWYADHGTWLFNLKENTYAKNNLKYIQSI